MISKALEVHGNENYFNNDRKKKNELIGDWPVKESCEVYIPEMKSFLEFLDISGYLGCSLYLSKMPYIHEGRYDEYRTHKDISSYYGEANGSNGDIVSGYPYTCYRERKYRNREPKGKDSKNPWSFYDDEFFISISNKSINKSRFPVDAKWLKKPAIDEVKRNHMYDDIHFSLSCKQFFTLFS